MEFTIQILHGHIANETFHGSFRGSLGHHALPQGGPPGPWFNVVLESRVVDPGGAASGPDQDQTLKKKKTDPDQTFKKNRIDISSDGIDQGRGADPGPIFQ